MLFITDTDPYGKVELMDSLILVVTHLLSFCGKKCWCLCGNSRELPAVCVKALKFGVFPSTGSIRQLLLGSAAAAAVAREGCYHGIYHVYVDGSC